VSARDKKSSINVDEIRKVFRVKLLNQFLMVGLFSAIFQLLINIFDDSTVSIYTEIVFAVILAILAIINKKGYFNISKTGTLIIINLALFFSFRIEPTAGIQYYYFPMVLLSFVLHDFKDWMKGAMFALLPILLFMANSFEHFEVEAYFKERDLLSIIINFTTASVVSSIALVYLIKSNISAENGLVRSNQELEGLSHELKVNNEILAKTNEELDKFMYSSSHDLRAPLTSILGLVNLAKLEPLEKQPVYLDMIRDRVIGLDYFIKEIIDFSKNARTDVGDEIIDVKELIELCVEHNKYLPDAEKIELSLDLETTKIKSDHYRLSSILTSLIANAVKYHNVDQEKPTLWVTVKGTNPVSFSVKDNGMGINKSIKPKIFNMFYRGSEKSNGSGLGLYIAKEMLNSLHGTFEVTSEEGVGTNFIFYVPNSLNK
jgi:signal transduction histidine kinase